MTSLATARWIERITAAVDGRRVVHVGCSFSAIPALEDVGLRVAGAIEVGMKGEPPPDGLSQYFDR